jgi:1-acyl-sn-glycerol-3-phosphate acyltransferase
MCRRSLRRLLLGTAYLAGLSLRLEGQEKLRELEPGSVLVSNHASYLDGFVMVAALDFNFRFVAKLELKKNFLVAWLFRRLNAVYVERFEWGQSVRDAHRLVEIAKSGPPLLVFPEGTFTRQAGLRPFHLGAFLVAAETASQVVPLIIKGTRDILRDGSWTIRRGPIEILVGDPVKLEMSENDAWSAALKLRARIRQEILEKVGEPSLDKTL